MGVKIMLTITAEAWQLCGFNSPLGISGDLLSRQSSSILNTLQYAVLRFLLITSDRAEPCSPCQQQTKCGEGYKLGVKNEEGDEHEEQSRS